MNNEFSQKVIEYNLSQQKAFNVLFDKNQKIAFQKTFKQMPTILAYPFPDGSLSYPFFVLNPLGYAEHRQKKNILSVQGLTLESDILSKPLQEEWYRTILGYASVEIFSGNRSIHFHHRFTRRLTWKEYRQILKKLKILFPFFDYAVLSDRTRLCRVPNGMRDGKIVQTIEHIGERIRPEVFIARLNRLSTGIKGVPKKAHALLVGKYGSSGSCCTPKGKLKLQEILHDLKKHGYSLDNFLGNLIKKALNERGVSTLKIKKVWNALKP